MVYVGGESPSNQGKLPDLEQAKTTHKLSTNKMPNSWQKEVCDEELMNDQQTCETSKQVYSE